MSNVNADDILRNNPDLAKQFATAAANQAGPGFGNFMNMAMNGAQAPSAGAPVNMFGSSAQAASQAAQEAQARARAEVNFQKNVGGTPVGQAPQAVAAMEPRQTARRDMGGPTGVDDILQSFAEARRNESLDGTAFPDISNPQSATAAAIEIQSMVSGDDIGSTTESRAGRGRRRRQPVGGTVSLSI